MEKDKPNSESERIIEYYQKTLICKYWENLGVDNSVAPPLTIPNREVKCAYADGTANAGE